MAAKIERSKPRNALSARPARRAGPTFPPL